MSIFLLGLVFTFKTNELNKNSELWSNRKVNSGIIKAGAY